MKAQIRKVHVLIMAVILMTSVNLHAQKVENSVNAGADLVSRYVWRGLDFGNAPAVQPTLEFSAGGFSLGAWGSYALSAVSYLEADLYMSYSFDFGLSVIATDYYFPSATVGAVTDSSYFDADSHIFELGLSQEIGNFYLSGYYFLNSEDDLYLEAGYSFDDFDVFLGGGNQSYTSDGDFMLTNIGISSSREIKFSESFTLPLTTAFIVNPDLEQVHIVVGVSF